MAIMKRSVMARSKKAKAPQKPPRRPARAKLPAAPTAAPKRGRSDLDKLMAFDTNRRRTMHKR